MCLGAPAELTSSLRRDEYAHWWRAGARGREIVAIFVMVVSRVQKVDVASPGGDCRVMMKMMVVVTAVIVVTTAMMGSGISFRRWS